MRRWLIVVVPLAVLGCLIGWRIQTKRAAAAMGEQQRQARRRMPATVSVAVAQVRDLVRTLESVGTVEAPLATRLAPEVSGRIVFLEVREGDRVRRGQVVLRLDATELRAQVAQRRAALAEAQHRLAQARITQVSTDASVSSNVREREAELASAEARYRQVVQNYEAQLGAAQASVTEMQGRVDAAEAAIGDAEAKLRSAQANLENALTQQKRVEQLFEQGYIAAQDVDNARTAASVQRAAVDAARSQQRSAAAARDAAMAQKRAAEQQVEIVKAKGKADIEAARAEVTRARAALAFAKADTSRRPAYRANLSALEASVAAAQAALANAEALLAQTEVRSPIDGFVTARNADPGAVATPGQPVLEVQAIDPVWVTVPVPEEAQRFIRVGHPGTVTFDALPGRRFTARVTSINTAADPATRQFSLRFTLPNPAGEVKPGMFARVSMEVERVPGAVVVPPEAVRQDPAGPMVVVVDANQVARNRRVAVGTSTAREVAIRKGLRPGERVVVLSAMPLRDGQEVRVGSGRPGRGGAGGSPGGREADAAGIGGSKGRGEGEARR